MIFAAMSSMKLTAGLKIVSLLVIRILMKKMIIIVRKLPFEAMMPKVNTKLPIAATIEDFQILTFS